MPAAAVARRTPATSGMSGNRVGEGGETALVMGVLVQKQSWPGIGERSDAVLRTAMASEATPFFDRTERGGAVLQTVIAPAMTMNAIGRTVSIPSYFLSAGGAGGWAGLSSRS